MAEVRTRRLGGREARKASRSAPADVADKAVRPGLVGGLYKPLGDHEVERIHQAILEVLETIGLADATPSCVELVTAAGGIYTDQGRLLFPRALVEDTIAKALRSFTLHGQRPEHDLDFGSKKFYFGTAGAAVHMVDPRSREYRDSTLVDLYNAARVVDQMEHIHYFQRPLVPRDLVESRDMDFNTCYASVLGTSKHVGSSWVEPEHVEESLAMLHQIAGGEDKWRARPFVSMSACFVVPPLRFAEDACRCMEVAVRGGMPVLLVAAGQAGATSPATLAGAVVQEMAEVLAGLVYVNLIDPGHPTIIGPWPFISDLRTGSMSGGSGEQAVLMAACAQMGRFYDLPTGVAAGMTDSKLPDAQSGFEKSYTNTLAAHAGANLVYESAGMQGSLLGCCLESYAIDNDMLGAINRTVRGVNVSEESLAVEVMRQVCVEGPVHFLEHPQTLKNMKKEYLYPVISDRTSPKEWKEQGSTDILDRAEKRIADILASHFPDHIDSALDQQLREHFDIKLDAGAMGRKY